MALLDNGHQKEYVYNDAGERVIKRGPQGETVYVNQFFVVRNRTIATKHIFAGNTRIASRMMPGNNGTINSSTTTTATTFPGQGLYHRSTQGNLNGKNTINNPNYSGAVTTTDNSTPGNTDNFLYFYHPDHLGSTSFVTDANGKLYEHIEYFPFGETWVEEHSNTQRTPYLFTGKELDEETGLYYFGARYYDPRTSIWQSADPILGKYLPTGDKEKDQNLPGMGGVYNPLNLGMYSYASSNPLRFIDPTGLSSKKTRTLQGVAISLGTQWTQDAAARNSYNKGASKLRQDDPMASAERSRLRTEARKISSPMGKVIAETMRPSDQKPRLGGRVNVTNPSVNKALAIAGKAGPALMAVGAGISVYNIATAPEGQKSRVAAKESGSWLGSISFGSAGGYAGAASGAAVGSLFAGVGAVPGSIIGGILGSITGGAVGATAGSRAGENVYDYSTRH